MAIGDMDEALQDVDSVAEEVGEPQPAGHDPKVPVEDPPEEIIQTIRDLLKQFGLEEMPNRRRELLRAREGRFFWAGDQYPMFNADLGCYAVPESGGFPWMAGTPDERNKRFFYVHNIYTPLGKSLVSSLAGNPPPVRFNPCNPTRIQDIDASKEAEKYREVFYKAANLDQMLRDTGRYAWTDGRTVAWVRQETDGRRFGYNEDGSEKTQEIVELFGVLENKCPLSLRWMKDFPYFIISQEKHITQLKDKYPDKAEKIKDHEPGPGEDAFDRTCRLAVLQESESGASSGESYTHLVTEQTSWIRYSAFSMVKDEEQREWLQQHYPDGCRVTYAGMQFLEAVNECMDDSLALFQPMSGDGQAIPALGRFVIPLQKRLNNLTNLNQEKYEKGSPTKFVDSKLVDEQAMGDQIASPETYMPVKKPTGEPLSAFFYKEPEPTSSPDLIATINGLKGPDSQMVSGVQPAMFGGSMTNAKTAAVYAQARDQALGSLNITYGPLKCFLATIVELATFKAEAREQTTVTGVIDNGRGGKTNLSVDLEKLRKGFYKCEPEVDEGLPETPSAQRQAFMSMIQFMGPNPAFQELITQPDNLYLLKQFTGIKGFTVPGADQRNVQLKEIEQLLLGGATPPGQEDLQKVAQHQTILQIAGQPSPQPKPEDMLRPSVEVDPVFDDHKIHFQECQRWMYSDDGQNAKMFNPKGYDNVRLHAMEHFRAMQGGPDAAAPMQDNVPNPQQAMQAATVQAHMGAHAQASAPQPSGPGPQGGPPAAPRLLNRGAKASGGPPPA